MLVLCQKNSIFEHIMTDKIYPVTTHPPVGDPCPSMDPTAACRCRSNVTVASCTG